MWTGMRHSPVRNGECQTEPPDGWTEGWMDERMDGYVDDHSPGFYTDVRLGIT